MENHWYKLKLQQNGQDKCRFYSLMHSMPHTAKMELNWMFFWSMLRWCPNNGHRIRVLSVIYSIPNIPLMDGKCIAFRWYEKVQILNYAQFQCKTYIP